jgi:uncharacterized membrane protein
MNKLFRLQGCTELVKISFVFLAGVLAVPFIIGSYAQIAPEKILGLVGSILILQPFAVVVGLGLGVNPVSLLLIMCSIGISVIFVLSGICDVFAEHSEWLRTHLKKIETITQKSEMVKKYGMYSLIPFIWVPGVGLYGCVLIAWLFRWRGLHTVAVIFAGWMLATALVMLASLGIMEILF